MLRAIGLLISGLFVFIVACSSETMSSSAYMQWVTNPDNGLIQTATSGDHEFILQYEPIHFRVLKKSEDSLGFRDSQFSLIDFEGLTHFSFTVKSINDQTVVDPSLEGVLGKIEKRMNLESEFVNDIQLISNNDTLSPFSFGMEWNESMDGQQFLVTFEGAEYDDFELRVDVSLFSTDTIFSFYFSEQILSSIPTVNLNQ